METKWSCLSLEMPFHLLLYCRKTIWKTPCNFCDTFMKRSLVYWAEPFFFFAALLTEIQVLQVDARCFSLFGGIHAEHGRLSACFTQTKCTSLEDFERHRHLLPFVCIFSCWFSYNFILQISLLKSKFSTIYFYVNCSEVIHMLHLDVSSLPL